MAFSYTTIKKGVMGDLKYAVGTFTNGAADTGGDITPPFSTTYYMSLQHTGASVAANAPSINESFPVSGAVTIVTDADADGIWFALGK